MTDRLEHKRTTGWPTVRRLFGFEQAADFIGVPVGEIRRRIRTGKLNVYHLGGGRVRIDEADLIANIPSQELEW